MVGLVVADTILVLLLGLLVAGLLRSHADIARKLHALGAPLGDPAREPSQAAPSSIELRRTGDGTLQIGPLLPPRSGGASVFDLEGVTPDGDGLVVAAGAGRRTLLCFLSSGCASCGAFWAELSAGRLPVPAGVRTVVVTKGPEAEQLGAIQRLAPRGGDVPVVMSSKAWSDYEVPGSPFFVLVEGEGDGSLGEGSRRLGEGTAASLGEVAELVRTATDDAGAAGAAEVAGTAGKAGTAGTVARSHDLASSSQPPGSGHRDHVPTVDEELAEAGIGPGDSSLYPDSVGDLVRGAPTKAFHRSSQVPPAAAESLSPPAAAP